jgi:hypothetical protein
MKESEKEQFLKDINCIPYWVKSRIDLFKFAKHLHYRLLQTRELEEYYAKKCYKDISLDDEIILQSGANEIYKKYDNCKSRD